MLKKILKNESGATSIEYGLIATFIFLVIVISVQAIGINLTGVFTKVVAGFK
jgi:pilus assembly protein Flp/PilA